MTRGEPRPKQPSRPEGADGRLWVEDEAGRRPFMRGILIHSLMARGFDFQEAYQVAVAVRKRLRGEAVVGRKEIVAAIEAVADPDALREARVEARQPPQIQVKGSSGELPFSKGFLSQSLLAAAIEPSDAFDVAREIEGELLRREQRAIDRHELRGVAYQTLHQRLGPKVAERYLAWRRYQEPERPVILLLGGATGVGKTALALEVGHRLGVARVISTDAIRQVMRIMLSPDLVPAIHASSFDAHRAVGDPASAPGADPVIGGFSSQADIVSVGVRAMIDRAVAENQNLILDGVSVVPGSIDLEAYRDKADLIFLLVAVLDLSKIADRFATRGRAAKERPPHRYLENLESIGRIQNHLLELAEQHDVPIVENDDFDLSVLSIIRHVTETLRKKDPMDVADLF